MIDKMISLQAGLFDKELKFTEVYRQFKDKHKAICEAMCLKAMYPANLEGIMEGDLLAGRTNKYSLVGFSLEEASGGAVYYCWDSRIREKMTGIDLDEEYRSQIEDMLTFWEKEKTSNKFLSALSDKLKQDTDNDIAGMFGRLAGVFINYDKLVRIGIPGLIEEVKTFKEQADLNGKDIELFEGMEIALEILIEVCNNYALEARALANTSLNSGWKCELMEMANILEKIIISKPVTFREALQLSWIYTLISGVVNYGRMDVYLGDFYVRDLESGVITEEMGLKLIQSLWKIIAERNINFNSRIIIGGKGRINERNADRFALAAMEATRTVKETEPQLTLRFYKGMNPELMKKALDVIGEGRIYPMLYNDDVNVEAVSKSFGISIKDAEQYLPYGCGEYAIDHKSFGSPNCSINLMKALEAALHNGKDALSGKALGLRTGEFSSFKNFEELFDAYKKQLEYYIEALAKRDAIENKIKDESASFLFISMLFDNCLESGKSIVGGGAQYLGAIVESFGMVNAADSLTAIEELVYDTKYLTQEQMLKVLDSNFEGFNKEHQIILDAPKYGNDFETADRMVQEVSKHICQVTRSQAVKVGFDYYLVVNINNFGNVTAGIRSAASADGRKNGEPLANGNTPTAGRDHNGVTAFLNSIVKVDPKEHAGYVHNIKFSRQMFTNERIELEALLNTYFDKGGSQAMITVVNRGDLENALREPEKYKNLIVRVGGFSARFIELSKDIQMDILNRTLYE
jgi:pyruvate-formate lyase